MTRKTPIATFRMHNARAHYARLHSKLDDTGRRVWTPDRPSFRAWVRNMGHGTVLAEGAIGKLAMIHAGRA